MDELEKITIRSIETQDLPALTSIYREAVLFGVSTFEIEPPDVVEMDRRRRLILAGGFPYLVAHLGGNAVGFAYANTYRTRAAFAATVENSVYISGRHQGRGVGNTLMRALIAECATLGFRQMIAVIGDSANSASIKLHQKLGFRFAGLQTSVGWKHDRWLDTVTMQLPLGEGDLTKPLILHKR
jgi:L-amino acid N-acyltransferase YncA